MSSKIVLSLFILCYLVLLSVLSVGSMLLNGGALIGFFYNYLPGNAGTLARICGGRGRPRSQSRLQSYEEWLNYGRKTLFF